MHVMARNHSLTPDGDPLQQPTVTCYQCSHVHADACRAYVDVPSVHAWSAGRLAQNMLLASQDKR